MSITTDLPLSDLISAVQDLTKAVNDLNIAIAKIPATSGSEPVSPPSSPPPPPPPSPPPASPPSPPSLPSTTNLTLSLSAKNALSQTLPAGSRITVGRAIAKDDLPAGYHLQAYASDGMPLIIQQDGTGNWNSDNSASFTTYSLLTSTDVSAGEKFSYTLIGLLGVPDSSPGKGMSIHEIVTTHDIKVKVYGGDCGADVFWVSMNDVVASCSEYVAPDYYGCHHPFGGWHIRKSGKVVTIPEWWRYLRRESDGANHAYIKIRAYTEHEANGDWSLQALMLENTNTYGPNLNGSIGNTPVLPLQFCAYVELYDGGKLIHAWGGPNDSRACVLDASAINVADSSITFPNPSPNGWKNGLVLQAQPGSVLPAIVTAFGTASGGTTSIPFFVDCSWVNADGKPRLCPARQSSWDGQNCLGHPALQPNHNYNQYDTVSFSGAVLMASNSGTSGANVPGPIIGLTNGTIQDGSVNWWLSRVPFSGGNGAGKFNCYPILCADAGAAAICMSPDGGLLPGSGQVVPYWLVYDDLDYLFFKSKLAPSYNPAIAKDLNSYPSDLGNIWPNQDYLMGFGEAINTTGEPPGDPRMGWINSIHCLSLMLPFDLLTFKASIANAVELADWSIYSDDEACGSPVVANNGPDSAGGQYPGLGRTNNSFYQHSNGVSGSPKPFATQSYGNLHWGYGPRVDFTHSSNWWFVPFLRTGREFFLDAYIAFMATQIGSNNMPGSYRDITLGGKTYYNAQFFSSQPGRQRGWFHKSLSTLEYLLPSKHPFRAYVKDILDGVAAAAPLIPSYIRSLAAPAADVVGVLGVSGLDNTPDYRVYMYAYSIGSAALDAWRDDRPEWKDLAAYAAKLMLTLWSDDPKAGGSTYFIDDYGVMVTTDGSANYTAVLPSVAAVMAAIGRQPGQPPTGIGAYNWGNGSLDTPYSGVQYNTGTNFEKFLCTIALLANAGVPGALEVWNYAKNRLPSGFSINYNAGYNGVAAPEWAIVPVPTASLEGSKYGEECEEELMRSS